MILTTSRLALCGALATAALLGACADAGTTGSPLGARTSEIVMGIKDTNHRYVVGVGGNNSAFCTGTVISKRVVLTAGHCIGGVKNIFLGPRITQGMATKIPVVEEIRHPQYADIPVENATYDLGILKLGADAPVQGVPLLRETMTNTPRFIGPSFVIVGYGITGGGQGGFGTKRVTTFPIHLIGPSSEGAPTYPDGIPETLWYYLNSETGGRNACNGDSGGPGFFVTRGVETLAGVTSSGDASCTLDGSDQRSDQPYIDGFIQQHIDEFEAQDHCRNDGHCDESCNVNGQLGDPDCAFDHCAADGICAEACVAPLDPDCTAIAMDNCGDNGVCDPTCTDDPDCIRDCGAEGNCIADCATPDPDCAPPPPPDAAPPLPGQPDATPPGPGEPDASTPTTGGADAGTTGNGYDAEGSGCGCRVGAATSHGARTTLWPIPLILLSLGLGWRRRRLRARRG